MIRLQGLLGIVVILLLCWLFSENRRRVQWRPVLAGLGLQFALAAVLLKIPLFRRLFLYLNRVVLAVDQATREGTSFIFGFVGGGEAPYDIVNPGAGYILAFQSLPIILVISALAALLFYWKILPVIVKAFSRVLERTMSVGGAEGLGVSANIFIGMVEAPLLVRPYLRQMSRSELFSLMSCGMATIAGTVMVLYATLLDSVIPEVLGHILTASLISAPAAITISRLLIPNTGPVTAGELTAADEYRSPMDAITKGTVQGLELVLNIIAMIIVLVSLVHLVNIILGLLPDAGGGPLTLQRLLGLLLAPLMWLLGIPWSEAVLAGSLMGTKTVLNELIAFVEMSRVAETALSPKSRIILMYALCGFANPGSLGIMIGGIGPMVPERRSDIVSLGMRSIVAGTLATCLTGAIAGIFLD